MKKNIVKLIAKSIVVLLCCLSKTAYCQQYINRPALDKFSGWWQSINGIDTIQLYCNITFVGNHYTKSTAALFYYSFTSGTVRLHNNFSNSNKIFLADFVGGDTNGSLNDSVKVIGMDNGKNKVDEGYFIVNAARTQLTWVRVIGVNGGGLNSHSPGEGPLQGYT